MVVASATTRKGKVPLEFFQPHCSTTSPRTVAVRFSKEGDGLPILIGKPLHPEGVGSAPSAGKLVFSSTCLPLPCLLF